MAIAVVMSAVFASSAPAAEFHSEGSSTVVTGSQEGTAVFATTGGTVECEEATVVGSTSGTTSTTISGEPTFSDCRAFGFASATINTNGCEFVAHSDGTGDLTGCNSSSGVIVTTSLFGTLKCKLTIVPQTGIGSATYTNVGSGSTREITVDSESANISYIEHGGTGFGACSSSIIQNSGEFEGQGVVTGEDANGNHIGIWYA